ncbi:unnamed protein product [Moneuplotes crassus]|uniref:Uncharacterized protein n=1 Tax=Euplotes crassus TaxID=5936 RepID=A0AAD1U3U5_EUPCR|nr:unnamed protein product [Moneuplotes crassus]
MKQDPAQRLKSKSDPKITPSENPKISEFSKINMQIKQEMALKMKLKRYLNEYDSDQIVDLNAKISSEYSREKKLIRELSILQTKAHSQKKGMLRENAQDSLKARSCHEARREESYNNHSQEREKLQKDIINKQIERILSQYESDEDLVKIRNHQPQKKNEIQQLEQKIKQLETSALEKSMLVRQKKLELKTLQRKIREKIIDIKQAKVLKKLKESQKNLKRVSKLRKTRNGKNKIQVDSESYMFKSDRGNDSHRSKETPLTLSHSEITPIKVLLTHKADKKKPKRVTPLPDLKRIKRNLIMKAYRPLTEYSYKLNEHRIQSIKMKGGCENEQKINKNEHRPKKCSACRRPKHKRKNHRSCSFSCRSQIEGVQKREAQEDALPPYL